MEAVTMTEVPENRVRRAVDAVDDIIDSRIYTSSLNAREIVDAVIQALAARPSEKR